MMKKGILLVNLGTPDSPQVKDVRKYLLQFLMDPYVINRPYWLRWLLVKGIIVPFRAKKSAHAYQQIWTERGSPLLYHSQDLQQKVQNALSDDFVVKLGMRYGNPSIENALSDLQAADISEVYCIPLYPQYAESSSQTAIDEVNKYAAQLGLSVSFEQPFFEKTEYIETYASILKPQLDAEAFTVFSFHGIPEEHLLKVEPKCAPCIKQKGCSQRLIQTCYRAQCFTTADLLAKKLDIDNSQYQVSFQSRLGKLPWIQPYSADVIEELGRQGIKKLQVIPAAFTADCLETIEEIGIGLKADFAGYNGGELKVLSCLNAEDRWAQTLANWSQQQQWATN